MREGWNTVRLGDVLERKTDTLGSAPEPTILTCTENHGLVDQLVHLGRRAATENVSKYKRVEPLDIVYNVYLLWLGAIGQNLTGTLGITSPVYEVFRPSSKVHPPYMGHLLRSPGMVERYSSIAIGTVPRRRRTPWENFLALAVDLPPLNEQRRIVDLIGAVDHAVDAADEYSKELLGSLRSQRAFLMTSEQRVVAAADAFEVTMGRQRSPERASGPSMTPYLRSANVLDGQLDLSDVKEMDFNQTERQKFTLRYGDVLVSEGSASSNAVGAAAMWRAELAEDVCFQNTLLRFRAVEAVSTPSFVYHWCRWAYESGAFREVSSGTNIRHIGSRRAELMPVHLPPVELQEGLTGLLDVGEATYEASLGYVAALRCVRSDLLTALLSGEHEISSTYDEVMSAGV